MTTAGVAASSEAKSSRSNSTRFDSNSSRSFARFGYHRKRKNGESETEKALGGYGRNVRANNEKQRKEAEEKKKRAEQKNEKAGISGQPNSKYRDEHGKRTKKRF